MTAQEFCEGFVETRQALVLSTLDENGKIETSTTPFAMDEGGSLYIFVSELSQHTKNLLWLCGQDQQVVSGLLLEDEMQTEQPFARQRLSFQARVAQVNRGTKQGQKALGLMKDRFGEIIDLLSGLGDFHLFALQPLEGGYVKGFGQAYRFEGCLCQNLRPVRN
ncbi:MULTISPECIES: HugZ family protein [Thiomicrorhabdus]|uniref:Pyridoxamine 5'-phosphate oxidase family protein n=1 Tax=Thiomicrorhabdus heinhorstiae TaxID=2748010 RepID=A0ABS0BXQ9_9GAMM|nr:MULTISPECIES: pyridoxamine 5'-phosphate oxidase family protein [Thiomicrorhabdus]MBF6057794.1 pyridoxamine 5'-phosphate oxidase family protein [Thiomicrorhabdus heinhorstiae]